MVYIYHRNRNSCEYNYKNLYEYISTANGLKRTVLEEEGNFYIMNNLHYYSKTICI